jgi:F0F1-type ATP synthase membrane subunit b/b'
VKFVKVSKDRLLATLQENRKKHVADYNEAVSNYHRKVMEGIEQLRLDVAGLESDETSEIEKLVNRLHFPAPQSFEKEYDKAIAQLEWETESELTLTEAEFEQLVRDNWGWKGAFAATSLVYNN